MIIDIHDDGLIMLVAENDADWRNITDKLQHKASHLGKFGVLTEIRENARQLLIMIDPTGQYPKG